MENLRQALQSFHHHPAQLHHRVTAPNQSAVHLNNQHSQAVCHYNNPAMFNRYGHSVNRSIFTCLTIAPKNPVLKKTSGKNLWVFYSLKLFYAQFLVYSSYYISWFWAKNNFSNNEHTCGSIQQPTTTSYPSYPHEPTAASNLPQPVGSFCSGRSLPGSSSSSGSIFHPRPIWPDSRTNSPNQGPTPAAAANGPGLPNAPTHHINGPTFYGQRASQSYPKR